MKIKNNDLKMFIDYLKNYKDTKSFEKWYNIDTKEANRIIDAGRKEGIRLDESKDRVTLKKFIVKNYTIELIYNINSGIYSGYIHTSKENTALYNYGGQCVFIIYDYGNYAVDYNIPKYIHDFIKKIAVKYY